MMVADAPKFPTPPRPSKAVACPVCGLRFLDLRKTGLVGCQTCYETFETRLSPLLQKAHDGGTRHAGKRPALVSSREVVQMTAEAGEAPGEASVAGAEEGEPGTVRDRIESLTHQLALAIEAENYERAAEIRDELTELTGDGGLGGFGVGGSGVDSGGGGGAS
jgi:protein-arginine kinase activator protein McsA